MAVYARVAALNFENILWRFKCFGRNESAPRSIYTSLELLLLLHAAPRGDQPASQPARYAFLRSFVRRLRS